MEAAAPRTARPAAATMMSAPVRVMRHGVMSVVTVQNVRPTVMMRTPYAASTTIMNASMMGVTTIGVTTIAMPAKHGAQKAAKLRESGLRIQNGGGRQSEKTEQQCATREPRRIFLICVYRRIALTSAVAHRDHSKTTLDL